MSYLGLEEFVRRGRRQRRTRSHEPTDGTAMECAELCARRGSLIFRFTASRSTCLTPSRGWRVRSPPVRRLRCNIDTHYAHATPGAAHTCGHDQGGVDRQPQVIDTEVDGRRRPAGYQRTHLWSAPAGTSALKSTLSVRASLRSVMRCRFLLWSLYRRGNETETAAA